MRFNHNINETDQANRGIVSNINRSLIMHLTMGEIYLKQIVFALFVMFATVFSFVCDHG